MVSWKKKESSPNRPVACLEKKKEEKPSLLESLPDYLLLTCIARVSRLHHPSLSLVSKRFNSLLASPELNLARSRLGKIENCLYICIRNYKTHWFTLCRSPDQTGGYVLVKVPVESCKGLDFSGLVAVGHHIYNIGGRCDPRFSTFSVLDCRSHKWGQCPSLPVKLSSVTASVIDQKIYVAGKDFSENNFFEVLDTTTQTWDPEPIPCRLANFGMIESTNIDGKFRVEKVHSGTAVTYSPKEGRWELVEKWQGPECAQSHCEVGNILYGVRHGNIAWFDTEVRRWRFVEVELPTLAETDYQVRLADYGGKIAVFWTERFKRFMSVSRNTVWCAVIAVQRTKSCEILGTVEWCGHVLSIRYPMDLVKVLSVTL